VGRSGVAPVPRGDARKALEKAEEFLASAADDLSHERWTAAGLNSIHAGISASDAALIAATGTRSASQDHGLVTALLDDSVSSFGASQQRQLAGLIKMKNTAAYEQRPLTQTEARQLADQARRFTRWARAEVGKMLD
jgi:HEPN domain-containing protein